MAAHVRKRTQHAIRTALPFLAQAERLTYNFNSDWRLAVADPAADEFKARNLARWGTVDATGVSPTLTWQQLVAAGQVSEVLAYPVSNTGNPYFIHPLYTSGGGYVFGEDPNGGYDPADLGVGSPGSSAQNGKSIRWAPMSPSAPTPNGTQPRQWKWA